LAILTGLHNKWLAAFRPPWTANEIAGGYVVRDADKQALAYVYCRESEHAASVAKVLTKDEARRIASNIAKLPKNNGRSVAGDRYQLHQAGLGGKRRCGALQ